MTDGETLDRIIEVVRECMADDDGRLTDGEWVQIIQHILNLWDND